MRQRCLQCGQVLFLPLFLKHIIGQRRFWACELFYTSSNFCIFLHWSLIIASLFRSPKTVLSIQADFSYAVIYVVSILPIITSWSSLFSRFSKIISRALWLVLLLLLCSTVNDSVNLFMFPPRSNVLVIINFDLSCRQYDSNRINGLRDLHSPTATHETCSFCEKLFFQVGWCLGQ